MSKVTDALTTEFVQRPISIILNAVLAVVLIVLSFLGTRLVDSVDKNTEAREQHAQDIATAKLRLQGLEEAINVGERYTKDDAAKDFQNVTYIVNNNAESIRLNRTEIDDNEDAISDLRLRVERIAVKVDAQN